MKKLAPTAYEHPMDRAALNALRKIPLIDKLCTWVINIHLKTDYIVQYRGNGVEVNEKLTPRVYKLKKLAEERLCMEQDIPMFITLDWDYNAFAMGVDEPIIVLNSSVVENFTDDELLYIIGHEMGHIKSKHMLYHWMGDNLSSWMFNNGILSGVALMSLVVAIKEWHRKSELTADRAGFIACQNKEAAVNGMLKLMGLPQSTSQSVDFNFSVSDILKQLEEYDDVKSDSVYSKFIYAYITCNMTHPWGIERIKEILAWDGVYQYEK